MKPIDVIYFVFVFFALLASAVYSEQSADVYTADFSGDVQKEKAFLKKLRQDETKIDLAVKNTRALINQSRNKAYLPELYLRLADLFVEKSRVTYFIRKSLKKEPLSKLEALPADALKNQAIEIYQRILDHFPDFDQRDKVYFFMAHEFRELGKIKDMIVHYRKIIKEYPKSTYAPETYLLLGDHYFKAQNLDMAQSHYTRIMQFTGSPAYAIAQYKLGWCHINRAEFKQAMNHFETALMASKNQHTTTDIDTYRHVDIRLESLIDMAYCYVDCYKKHPPQTAIAYFESYAWSLASYISSLEKLAKRYFIKKKWTHSAAIYRKLSHLSENADKLLLYAHNIFECVRESGKYDSAAFDVQIIVKALEKQRYASHISTDARFDKEKEYEVFAREMITLLHDDARKNNDKTAFHQASKAYMAYLDFFYQSPVLWDMKNNCAECLFASENYLEAGKQYETLYHEAPSDKIDREQVLYASITSYYHALKNKQKLQAYGKNYSRQGLLATGQLYVDAYPDAKHVQDVRFNMAWITFDEGHYDTAIAAFQSFISTYPNGRAARAAIHLIMDAYYMKEDFKSLVDFGNRIIANPEITNEGLKKEIATIVASAEQKIVYSLSLSAIDDWEKGRTQMFTMAQKHANSALGEKALIALLGSALEKNDLKTFFSAGKTLVETFPQSKNHENHLNLLIQTSMTMGDYKLLVKYLERFCKSFPDHNDTPLFIEQTAYIYQQLGDYSSANRIYQKQVYSGQKQLRIDPIVFQWANNLIQSQLLTDAISVLNNALLMLSKQGQIIAQANLATIYYQTGQLDQAEIIYEKRYPLIKTQEGTKIRDALLEMLYYSTIKDYETYLSCQMSGQLDPKLFKEKQTQFKNLQNVYNQFLKYPSPRWVLAACANLYKIYSDFAQFLRNSPAPEMTDAEKKQYQILIEKKAAAYEMNAKKFHQTFQERAQKWSICDPQLIPWMQIVTPERAPKGPFSQVNQVAAAKTTNEMIPSTELLPLYQDRVRSPNSITPVLALANAYVDRKEWGQAFLLCGDGLKIEKISDTHKSTLYTIQGTTCLYQQKDKLAQVLFQKALAVDAGNTDAQKKREALLRHYGYGTL